MVFFQKSAWPGIGYPIDRCGWKPERKSTLNDSSGIGYHIAPTMESLRSMKSGWRKLSYGATEIVRRFGTYSPGSSSLRVVNHLTPHFVSRKLHSA